MAGSGVQTSLVVEPHGTPLPVLLESYAGAKQLFPMLPAPFSTKDAKVWRFRSTFEWWACIGTAARLQLLRK